RQANLSVVPTEFASLLDYQKMMCELVLKETLAGRQQELTSKKYRRNDLIVKGQHHKKHQHSSTHERLDGAAGSRQMPSGSYPVILWPCLGCDRLFSLGVRLEMTGLAGDAGEEDEADTRRLRGNDLVSLRSPMWPASEAALLGVVQSWDPDPVHKHSGKAVRILEDVGKGKRSVGGRSGRGRGDRGGTPITICRFGTLATACREYQAVMSLSELPPSTRRCLLDPSVAKEVRAPPPRPKPPVMVVRSPSFSVTLGSGVSHGRGGGGAPGHGKGEGVGADPEGMEEAACPPPSNVPLRLWEAVVRSFNRSQARAIRKVADGSPSGFTLLQGPPGTGKTRTIMGIVGVLLAGDFSYPVGQAGRHRGPGAKIMVGSSISPRRVLIVAPSNAAVDELVLRLCQDGVPGHDGCVYFPRVVRVGGPRADADVEGEDGGDASGRWGGKGAGDDGDRSAVVEKVSLERLVKERKRNLGGSVSINRLNILLQAQVVCATLSGAGSKYLVEPVILHARELAKQRVGGSRLGTVSSDVLGFDAVVMDEAAQAVEPSSMIPLKFNPRAVIMVGDPAQLPATIFSQEATRANFGQSLFQRLQRGGHPKTMLDTQYRMHPDIASFASTRFYNGLLRSASTVTEISHGQEFHRLPRFAPYLFHNVSGGRLMRGGTGSSANTSLSNPVEVDYITSLLHDLVITFPGTDFNGRIGVIAPYRNQIQALQRKMRFTGLRQDGVEICTVDGFQGREKEIMIFSCVRAPEVTSPECPGANSIGGVGFLDDWRRLNVAITRAKFAMWIVGHAGVLKQSTEWRELINDSKKRGAFVDNNPSPPARGASSDPMTS
ncbi:unnamed protein product, partial [Scytosiphon promiscuus]